MGCRHRVLLHYRAAAVRADLLEIAALLEHAHDPDPGCVAALRDLLRNDASPLYHAAVDASELHATLDRARVALRRPPQYRTPNHSPHTTTTETNTTTPQRTPAMQPRAPKRLAAILALVLTTASQVAPVALAHSPTNERDAPPSYTVTDLGTLGGTFGFAMGINDRGWVDGFSTLPNGDQHAFVWRDSVMTDVGTPGGPNSGLGFWGEKPNEPGAIAVTGETSTIDPHNEQFCSAFNSFIFAPATRYQCRPFVWRDGMHTPLPTFGGNNGAANQINDRSQVVGTAETPNRDRTCTAPGSQVLELCPALWQHGAIYQLHVLPGDDNAVVDTINDPGQAAGVSVGNCAGFPAHAVLWQGGVLSGRSHGQADVVSLGTLGGPQAQFDEAADINNQGQVVGLSSLPGNTYFHGFLWERRTGMQYAGPRHTSRRLLQRRRPDQ